MVAFLLKGVRPSLTSFVVAVLAVGLAWLWLKISVVASLVFVVAGAALGFGAFGAGRRLLRSERPKPERAVSYLDWTVMAPGAVAAAVGAVLIVVAIDIAPGDHASSETKALLGAIGAAVSTYLTTVFIKGAEEADTGWVGELVKDELRSAFNGHFPEGSEPQQAVFSDVRYGGWGRQARRERARVIERSLG